MARSQSMVGIAILWCSVNVLEKLAFVVDVVVVR